MKVLHVVNVSFVLPYYIGSQFDYFNQKGVQFYVACTPDDLFFKFSKAKKVVPIPLNILRKISIWADIKAVFKLYNVIKREKIDIVIGHTPKGALIGMLAAALAKIDKRIYFRHGLLYETSTGFKRSLLMQIEKFTGRLATKVVCVSSSVLEVSNREKLSHPTKNIMLNKGTCNGIDATVTYNKNFNSLEEIEALRTKYGIEPGDQVIGFVGRLVNDKGINALVAAWQELLKKKKNIKLLLVGPFEKRDALDQEVVDYISNEKTIIHTGLIEKIAPFYGLMTVFVLPSYREGFPTVVLEASAMEIPVITTKSTGCIDSIIENETGLFTSIKPEAITEKITYYLANEHIATEHGKNGREFVLKNFDQEVIWQEIDKKLFH